MAGDQQGTRSRRGPADLTGRGGAVQHLQDGRGQRQEGDGGAEEHAGAAGAGESGRGEAHVHRGAESCPR